MVTSDHLPTGDPARWEVSDRLPTSIRRSLSHQSTCASPSQAHPILTILPGTSRAMVMPSPRVSPSSPSDRSRSRMQCKGPRKRLPPAACIRHCAEQGAGCKPYGLQALSPKSHLISTAGRRCSSRARGSDCRPKHGYDSEQSRARGESPKFKAAGPEPEAPSPKPKKCLQASKAKPTQATIASLSTLGLTVTSSTGPTKKLSVRPDTAEAKGAWSKDGPVPAGLPDHCIRKKGMWAASRRSLAGQRNPPLPRPTTHGNTPARKCRRKPL